MTLPQVDRDILRAWNEHGIPFDRSTVQFASELIGKLFAEVEELSEQVSELTNGGGD